jgi:hypothetical protein
MIPEINSWRYLDLINIKEIINIIYVMSAVCKTSIGLFILICHYFHRDDKIRIKTIFV